MNETLQEAITRAEKAEAEVARLEALIVNDAGTGWKQKANGYLRQLHECNNASAAETKALVITIFNLREEMADWKQRAERAEAALQRLDRRHAAFPPKTKEQP